MNDFLVTTNKLQQFYNVLSRIKPDTWGFKTDKYECQFIIVSISIGYCYLMTSLMLVYAFFQ